MYTDLMFNSSELLLLKWLEEFEQFCQKKIFEKKELWFHNDITLNDIQEMMNPLTRIFKSGKYTILRAQIKNNKIKIYDENETILDLENLKLDDFIIPLIHLNGIKFTSNNFTIDINLVQLMIVTPEEELNNCIINIKNNKTNIKNNINLTSKTLEENINDKNINDKNINDKNNIIFNLDKKQEIGLDQKESNNEQPNIEESNREQSNSEELNIEQSNSEELNTEQPNSEELNEEQSTSEENTVLDKTIKFNDTNLTEVNLDEIKEVNEKIDIKEAEMVYYEIYKAARKKAKQIKQSAIEAYLEAKKIKNQYMLQDIDNSSDSEIEELSNTL
tara:strand:- start:159 stop:1154 length:996 start_codon:yes stop_codon:yes gene_type:complete